MNRIFVQPCNPLTILTKTTRENPQQRIPFSPARIKPNCVEYSELTLSSVYFKHWSKTFRHISNPLTHFSAFERIGIQVDYPDDTRNIHAHWILLHSSTSRASGRFCCCRSFGCSLSARRIFSEYLPFGLRIFLYYGDTRRDFRMHPTKLSTNDISIVH